MKKFIISLFLFVIFAAIFYIPALIIFPSFLKKNVYYPLGGNGHLNSRIKDLDTVSSTDVLFLGSSHAYRGFDTRIFKAAGINSFNLGSSAQTPIQTHLMVGRYVDQLKPSTIIYEVDPMLFSSDGVESSLDLIANDKISFSTVKMAVAVNDIKIYNTLVYGIYRQIFNLNAGFKEAVTHDKDTYIKGGFVEREMKLFHREKYKVQQWTLKEEQINSFHKTLSFIKSKGIKVILVQAPITPDLYNSYTNNDEFDSLMSATNLPYYNFNGINLDDSLYFFDYIHLNQRGVEIFNDTLIKTVFHK